MQDLPNAGFYLGLLFLRLRSDIGLREYAINDALVAGRVRDNVIVCLGWGKVVLAGGPARAQRSQLVINESQ